MPIEMQIPMNERGAVPIRFMKTNLSLIEYAGWPNCLRLSDGRTELIVTADVGPRVIRFGRVDGKNVFREFENQLGQTRGSKWRIFGGHRFWIAPESKPLTYVPDNDPVPWEWDGNTLRLIQKPDKPSGLQKQLDIRLVGGAVHLTHTLINRGRTTQSVAPWALSVMAPGGIAVLPQEPYGSHTRHLLPARPLVLWKYTKMNDPRWTWGENFIQLRQDPRAELPQKIGFRSSPAWMAYALPFGTFIKRHTHDPQAVYPDMGCNAEVFTNSEILELETLAPLTALKPGARAVHTEAWRLFDEVIEDFREVQLLHAMEPMIRATPRAQ